MTNEEILYQIIQITDDTQEKIIYGLGGYDKKTAKKLVDLLNDMDMTIKHYGHKIEFRIEKERISEKPTKNN